MDVYRFDLARLNATVIPGFVVVDRRNGAGTWWQRRSRLERRLSLCATVVVFVAVGLAIAMAALIYRTQQSTQGIHTHHIIECCKRKFANHSFVFLSFFRSFR